MKTYLADNNIKLFATYRKNKTNHQGDHVSVFHKEKHRKVYWYPSRHCIKMLQLSYHRNVKMAPKDVNKDNDTQVWVNLFKKDSFINEEKQVNSL